MIKLIDKYITYCSDNKIQIKPKKMDNINVLFVDLIGFTTTVKENKDNLIDIYNLMNNIFTNFDILAQKNNVYKVETIGDCYMAITGIYEYDTIETSKRNILTFAHQIIEYITHNTNCKVRIGIASGNIIYGSLGLIDNRINFIGNCINLASRLQSCADPNTILLSEDFFLLYYQENKKNLSNNSIKLYDEHKNIEFKIKNIFAKGIGYINSYNLTSSYYTTFLQKNKIFTNIFINNFKPSILIIDDCYIVRKIMKKMLESLNVNVYTCDSPETYINCHMLYFYNAIIIDNNYINSDKKGYDIIKYVDNPYSFICLFSSKQIDLIDYNLNDNDNDNDNDDKVIYKPWQNKDYIKFINNMHKYHNKLNYI